MDHTSLLNNNARKPDGSSELTRKMERSTMIVIFLSLLADLLAFTMILPLLPTLMTYYGSKEDDVLYDGLKQVIQVFRDFVGAPDTPKWNAVLFGGFIGSLFSYLQFLSSPILGAASDVYGRRPVMLISMCGVALSYVLWAMSNSFTLFVMSRLLGGVSKGNISLSTAIVADIMPIEKRGKGMALIGIAFSLGFLVGPMIGAFFSKMISVEGASASPFFVYPAYLAVFLASFDIIFVFFCLKETLPRSKRASSFAHSLENAWHLINPGSLFRFQVVKLKSAADFAALKRVGLVYFLYLFFYSGLEFTLTFLVHNNFNYTSMQQGKMFFYIGAIMICVQGGYVRRLKPGTELKLATRGLLILIPGFVLVGLAVNIPMLYAGLALFAFASSTVVPCLTTLASSYGDADQKGVIMGIFRSLGALARALGPLLASTVYWIAGSQLCYICGAIMLILPYTLLRRLKVIHED